MVLLVGTNSDWETEGNDRSDLNLPGDQNKLIETVLEINPNTIIVLNTGSPIRMPWIDKAKTVLQSWYPGQEFGNALVDVITGDANPSGKLPTSFPKNIEDTPAFSSYPGKDLQMNYEEELLVGYKWYERKNIKPLFPFGHGLSYTKFKYSNLKIIDMDDGGYQCEYDIKNVGDLPGSEISQCYVVTNVNNEIEPIKKLQGFNKVYLAPGEQKRIQIILSERSFSVWSTNNKDWIIQSGSHQILIGASSEDIQLSSKVNL